MNSPFELSDALLTFEHSQVTTARGYKRLANQLAHQLTSLPFTLQQKKQFKAQRPKFDEPQVRKILRALRRRPMSRTEISNELFGRDLSSAKIGEALECLRSLGLADSLIERIPGRGPNREIWFAT
jgi:hypothetical protein